MLCVVTVNIMMRPAPPPHRFNGMNQLQQIALLLSEPPGNLVFHLMTLFALQAVLAISYSAWRRQPADQTAWRGMVAAAGVLLVRLILLITSMIYANDPIEATAVLPLLEQAVNTATAAFLVWALAPHADRLPRLGDLLLVMGLLMITAMFASFTQTWRELAAAGEAYSGSTQATVWGLLQISLLAAGIVLTLLSSAARRSLGPAVLLLLLLAHVAQFWNYPQLIPVETNITYWVRFGYLIIFPLWAVMAYRQFVWPLVAAAETARSPLKILARAYQQAAETAQSLDETETLHRAVRLLADSVRAPFVAVGVLQDEAAEVRLVSNQPQVDADRPQVWRQAVADWSAFEAVVGQQRPVSLRADGAGAGQLHRLSSTLGVGELSALWVAPLLRGEQLLGLLMLAERAGETAVHPQDREIANALSGFVAQLLLNARAARAYAQAAAQLPVVTPLPDGATAVSGRLIALEEERDRLAQALEVANNRLLQAESRAAEAGKRAHDLAATLDELERTSKDERVESLEREIETLRESLIEAEEAMALASAGEGGLSTEWVMMTITRYSGQLEEAQARIEALEAELARRDEGPVDAFLVSVVQELRTPMTSIAGFTELLLAETMGILGVRQRDLLQRVRANTERMNGLLDQILQMVSGQDRQGSLPDEQVDVREVIETAVSSVITQVREKRLQLDLDIADNLPLLDVDRQDFHLIVTNLLGNACQASKDDGRVAVIARSDAVPASRNGSGETIRFVQLTVTDSGSGIAVEDRPRVFDPHHRAEAPLIAGIGDKGAGLAMARQLAEANGGRIWVDSAPQGGSTFSLLFTVEAENGDGQTPEGIT